MVYQYVRSKLKDVLNSYDGVVIWGAGSKGGNAYRWIGNDVLYFVDSFSELKDYLGLSVFKPDHLLNEKKNILLVIASIAADEIEAWLGEHDFQQDFHRLDQLVFKHLGEGKSFRNNVVLDLYRYLGEGWIEAFLQRPQFLVNISFRIVSSLRRFSNPVAKILFYLSRIPHTFFCVLFSIEIPPWVEAGPGLLFPHSGGIVFHPQTKLGSFCTIYQCTTLGANRRGRAPHLGDYVTIWGGTIVVGDCFLGAYTEVGANSTCVGPLKVENAILVGSPAKIIRQNACSKPSTLSPPSPN